MYVIWVSIAYVYAIKAHLCRDSCSECYIGVCTKCLDDQYWGITCQNPCTNCWIGGCDRHTGRCFNCKDGTYGEDCRKSCPKNCRVNKNKMRCHRDTGECPGGCSEGWWGLKCDRKCGAGCQMNLCNKDSGVCDCNVGWDGPQCECNGECSSGVCYKDIDVCPIGCQRGWRGRYCIEKCEANCLICPQYNQSCNICKNSLYGSQCQYECSPNCVDYACDMFGVCVRGCISGFHGDHCNEACPYKCLECKQDTGICIHYEDGFTGGHDLCKDTFSQSCPGNTKQKNTEVERQRAHFTIGSVGILILSCTLSGALVFWLYVKFCKGKKHRNNTELYLTTIHPPPVDDDYDVINEYEMDEMNASGQTAEYMSFDSRNSQNMESGTLTL